MALRQTRRESPEGKDAANAVTMPMLKALQAIAILTAIMLSAGHAVAQIKSGVSEIEKREFLTYLQKLPTKGEFFAPEAVRSSRRYMPVLLALTEKDIEGYDLYAFLALSRDLSDFKAQRQYAVSNFRAIAHPTIKTFWGLRLFDEHMATRAVKSYLREGLDDPERAKMMKEILGPDFDKMKDRLSKP